MITNYSQAYKTWVFTNQTNPNLPVGRLMDFVIDADKGVFEALWVQSVHGLRLLSPEDIVRWNTQEIIIQSEKDLVSPDAFPRIKKIQEHEVPILNNKVFSEKDFLGKVKDFAFDTLSPRIVSLLVRSGWGPWKSEKIIPRHRIIKITPTGIFVSQNILPLSNTKEKKETTKPLPEIDPNT